MFADFPNWFSICWKRQEFTSAHAGFRLRVGHCTENQLCSLQHLVPQCKELLQQGQPRAAQTQPGIKTPPADQDLVSSAWGCRINSLFFSHRLAQRNREDGPTSSSYPLQNICLHKYLRACRVSKSPASTLENSTDAGYLELTGDRNAKTHIVFLI